MTDGDVEDEPDAAQDDAPPAPLIHRPQGNWLDDRLDEYLRELQDLGFASET
ncbi:MAG TPA: hypothetical protein VMW08_10100 [Acidimicrobiales bacterium]|nr:hypothetical protein [Acidimicrobiales bacterium]